MLINPGLSELLSTPSGKPGQRTSTTCGGWSRWPAMPRSESVGGHQARQQACAGHRNQGAHRSRRRSGQPVRRAGEAHSRVQASAPQRAACGRVLPSAQGQSWLNVPPRTCHLRWQGCARLRRRQAHHQVDPRRRRGGERRPGGQIKQRRYRVVLRDPKANTTTCAGSTASLWDCVLAGRAARSSGSGSCCSRAKSFSTSPD